jgi:hypothetical protein
MSDVDVVGLGTEIQRVRELEIELDRLKRERGEAMALLATPVVVHKEPFCRACGRHFDACVSIADARCLGVRARLGGAP